MKNETTNKNRERALKAWDTMRKRGYVKKKDKKKEISKKYNNKLKQEQREILIKLLKESLDDFKSNNPLRNTKYLPKGVCLESPQLHFIKMLDKENLLFDMMFIIPNHLESKKFNIGQQGYNMWGETRICYEEHTLGAYWNEINNVVLVEKSYNEFIKSLREEETFDKQESEKWNYVFIWADYCGAFSTFSEDIKETFDKKILGNGSIFAITFSIRDMAKKKKLPKYSKTNCIVALNDWVMKCSKTQGYKAELLPESGTYKPNMYTGIFKITHPQLTEDTKSILKLQETHDTLVRALKNKINDIKRNYE